MQNLRRHTDAQLEAQRVQASQARRASSEIDVVSLYHAVKVKIEEGRIDEARAMVAEYRKGSK